MRPVSITELDFGECEAELDHKAIESSFYESDGWAEVNSRLRLPFVIGRKGSGKSAIAVKLELEAKKNAEHFIRLVPREFRHVEVRELLRCLVSTDMSWQYIYHEVWEGIILGQLVRFILDEENKDIYYRLPSSLKDELHRFEASCTCYMRALDDALVDVLENHIAQRADEKETVKLVALRRLVQPYNWKALVSELDLAAKTTPAPLPRVTLCIDGLDEHWDSSPASMYLLAQGLEVVKSLSGKLQEAARFIVCVRDSIFRALVDTKAVEYDKLESSIIDLEWNSRSLFELISRRAFPYLDIEVAIVSLREVLPSSVDGMGVEDYLGLHVLKRPRDYINFFRLLQSKCLGCKQASESQVIDVARQYCANRLVDLENEFGFTYPGITQVITGLGTMPRVFTKDALIQKLDEICSDAQIRRKAQALMLNYGDPIRLAMILVSLGVIGFYDRGDKTVSCVQEFSETRVTTLFSQATHFGLHPVYRHTVSRRRDEEDQPLSDDGVAVISGPTDYLAEKDHIDDLEEISQATQRRKRDLTVEVNSIIAGREQSRRFEVWVQTALAISFIGDLAEPEDQVVAKGAGKRFEILFDIIGEDAPWGEIRGKFKTHRLLVECKNTDSPTDTDISKLERDMESLDMQVAFLAYRAKTREPSGALIPLIRSRYLNSKKEHVIIAVTDVFIKQCLGKATTLKCRDNLNKLWKLHVQRLLPG